MQDEGAGRTCTLPQKLGPWAQEFSSCPPCELAALNLLLHQAPLTTGHRLPEI